ncbi:MAG TPA: nucleotidyltransferase domain-containing protein [Candidatus Nanoarchaeia archaeon]|nr:nucleotidyltransferase domain-containing protein [Candidatus Nanoarchaeia archaeon]
MSIKQRILAFLIENKTKAFSIKDISRYLKIDYKLSYINVKKLEEGEIIDVEDLKNVKRCSFKDRFNEDVFIVETERKNKILRKKELKAVYDRLKRINKLFIVLLFGSYVKGTVIKSSDIDLLLIADEANAREIESKLEILPFKIHLTHVHYDAFIDMIKSKEQSVVSEAIKNNIIFFGVEDYYRLVENAR